MPCGSLFEILCTSMHHEIIHPGSNVISQACLSNLFLLCLKKFASYILFLNSLEYPMLAHS